jgi:hypothetical protein
MDAVKTVADVMQDMTSDITRIAVLVAGIGALSMALIEAVKGMMPLRALFQRKEIKRWFKGEHFSSDMRAMGIKSGQLPSADSPDKAYEQLLRLAIGGEQYQTALFEMPPEKLFGEIQAAVTIAMDFPDVAPDLYEFLTHDPAWPAAGVERAAMKKAMVKAVQEKKADAAQKKPDQDTWRDFAAELNAGEADLKTANPEKKKQYLDANQARQRLDNLVRRRLDALQTRISYRWSRGNQIAAFLVAVGFSVAALVQVPKLSWLSIAILAVAAGFLAPPAKDLAAALKQIRYK